MLRFFFFFFESICLTEDVQIYLNKVYDLLIKPSLSRTALTQFFNFVKKYIKGIPSNIYTEISLKN